MNIVQLFRSFLEYKKPLCKKSTLGTYSALFGKLCRTGIVDGEMDAENFDSTVLQNIYDQCKASGQSERTARDICTLMKNIIHTSALQGLCSHRLLQIRYSREGYGGGDILKVYRKDEISEIFGWLEANPHFWTLGVYIAVYTGARIGEVCGLKWSDVDFHGKTIHVERTVERVFNFEGQGTSVEISTAKTRSSNRLLPLSKNLERILKKWFPVSRPEFYITSNSTRPIEPRLMRDRFVDACQNAGVRYKGFHSLRHTFATMMLESGVDIKTISDILGHSGVEITMNIYSHPSDTSKRKAVEKTFKKLRFE